MTLSIGKKVILPDKRTGKIKAEGFDKSPQAATQDDPGNRMFGVILSSQSTWELLWYYPNDLMESS